MAEPDPLIPFAQRAPIDQSLRPSALVIASLALALVGGVALGALVSTGPLPYRVLRAIFFAAAFAYAVLSSLDFWEHFRLEKAATGRFWSMSVLPVGETINHAATGAVIIAMFVLARPIGPVLLIRDW